MKIANAPQPQPGRNLTKPDAPTTPAPTPETPSTPAPPTDQPPTPAPKNEKLDTEITMKEFKNLFKSSRAGMAIGALTLGGLAAGLGAMGGVVGGVVGATAAFTLGTAGVIGGGGGLGYLGITKGPQDVRALFYGFGGLVVGGVVGGLLGHYGGGALGALAGVHGGLAGATAGIISAAPVGALIGGVVHARTNLKEHGDQYPNLLKAIDNAKKEAAKEEADKNNKKP